MKRKKSKGQGAGGYQVFLSHATTDKWLAKTLCEKIEASGATTFRDDRDTAVTIFPTRFAAN
jgi:hypothetical protein